MSRLFRSALDCNRPFCRTLISPPTEFVNWVWHACWAATVFAPLMHV
jgi:hypothetical protein